MRMLNKNLKIDKIKVSGKYFMIYSMIILDSALSSAADSGFNSTTKSFVKYWLASFFK